MCIEKKSSSRRHVLNDLKQQILERNSKLSEIERRAFAEAHTPKNFMDVEKKSLEFWASTDPHTWPGKKNCNGWSKSQGGAGGDH